jgi:hypothetical protein
MKLARLIVIAAALVSACACSSNQPAPERASSSTDLQAASVARIADPCKLLTQAEASEAMGASLEPGVLRRFGVITRCTFSNKRVPEQDLFLDVHNETAPESDSVLFDGYTHVPDIQHVAGIGDQALWAHSELSTRLDIFKGGRLVEVGLPRTVATMTPALEKAGKLIASRM